MCGGGLDGVRMSVGASSSICSPVSLNGQTLSHFSHLPPAGNLFAVISEKFHLICNVCVCDRERETERSAISVRAATSPVAMAVK